MIDIGTTYLKHATVDKRVWKKNLSSKHGVYEGEMDYFSNEEALYDPDMHYSVRWDDIEPYLDKLSTLDHMIVWYYYHEYYHQTEIAKMLHWGQPKVRFRILKILKTLKLLMREPLTYAELDGVKTLSSKEKMYLLLYDQCLGNTTHVGRMLKKNQSSVRYIVLNAKRKLNGSHHKIMDKLSYTKDPVFVRSHLGQIFDPLVTR